MGTSARFRVNDGERPLMVRDVVGRVADLTLTRIIAARLACALNTRNGLGSCRAAHCACWRWWPPMSGLVRASWLAVAEGALHGLGRGGAASQGATVDGHRHMC